MAATGGSGDVAIGVAAAGSGGSGAPTVGGSGGNVGPPGAGPFESKGIEAPAHDCNAMPIGTCCAYDFCLDAEDTAVVFRDAAPGAGGAPDLAEVCQGANRSFGFCTFVTSGPEVRDGKCCFSVSHGSCCGRRFMVEGVARLADVQNREDWGSLAGACSSDDQRLTVGERQELAAVWAADALLEHASIASFARFSLELLAVGAPASLVEAAQRAALDEIEHARSCFALASRFEARPLGPGPLAMRGLELERSLAELAVAVFHEGCVGETLAAALAREQLAVAVDEQCRTTLTSIARDEAEHSLLAWRFLRYAVDRGGSQILESLREALSRTPRSLAVRKSSASAETLNHYGRLTPAQESEVVEETWRELIAPAAELLITPNPALRSATAQRC
jgi:hypothetical protein